MPSETVVILGIPIDSLSMEEAIEGVFAMVEAWKSDRRARQIATVNVNFIVNAFKRQSKVGRGTELLDILRRADIVTADGMPVIWASRLLGFPLKERVTGADLVPRLAEEAARRGKSLYFLGGGGNTAKEAAAVLKERCPGLVIAGTDAPRVDLEKGCGIRKEEADRSIIERINRSRPDILLIAMGNPKQEIWFHRNRERLKVPVSIGVGGTFAFISGRVLRAPGWVQDVGLEWLYRLFQEPGRLWKRYLADFFQFVPALCPLILYCLCLKARNRIPTRGISPMRIQREDPGRTLVVLPNPLTMRDLKFLKEKFLNEFMDGSSTFIIDFRMVRRFDPRIVCFLMDLMRKQSEEGKLFIKNPGPPLLRFFKLNRTLDLFRKLEVGDSRLLL
ncbi:MAG: WecB/TagA/CpsF family glycosyltransferase [Deltaproteobacteria bacterium]|nr:WecB/TagA/CpsF family glycosyltransferase [Deltaproteobacteria bacterium]MBW2305143.1 WecB/TagA/CpsF family glycosyltransferase [Deltaproteobacteria bacterium]